MIKAQEKKEKNFDSKFFDLCGVQSCQVLEQIFDEGGSVGV
jgi:hypothetical protein